MMRSLFSGVSGLKTHQTKMDVIGNNIANVNTIAFKSSSTTFSEIMYQTMSGASGPSVATGRGGVNAKQIGLGVTSGSISVNITSPGATQTTGDPFDLKITGDAFFVVSNGRQNLFTKAGSFYVDAVGNLAMKSTGYNVMGWQVDPLTGDIKKDTVSALRIMEAKNLTSPPEATTKATVAGILDQNNKNVNTTEGQVLNLNFYDALGYAYTARFAIKGVDAGGTALPVGEYDLVLTDVLDQNSKSILGDPPAIPDGIFASTPGTNVRLKFNTATGVFESLAGGNQVPAPVPAVPGWTPPPASIMLNLKDSVTTALGADVGGKFENIELDFTAVKKWDNGGNNTIAMDRGDNDAIGAGKKVGDLTNISINFDGRIFGAYDNGNTILLGQVATATFANASGLEKLGENCYQTTLNSGEFDGIGKAIDSDGGSMTSGTIEMSNVDLSTEFTEMIITQRGFQANSRIITTSDSLLEELVNLKR
ncbi:flagellar hook-basal body complex protein [Lachnospiraceae bacterium ZAX-1]